MDTLSERYLAVGAAVGPPSLVAHRATGHHRLAVRVLVQAHIAPEAVASHLQAAPHLGRLDLVFVNQASLEFWRMENNIKCESCLREPGEP